MRRNGKEIVASALVLSAVGYAMWPWQGGEFWKWFMHLPEPLRGDFGVLALAMILTTAIGFLLTARGGIRLSNLAIGGILAYAVWMAVLTTFFELHDPVPFLVYGQVLVGVLLGAAVETVLDRGSKVATHTRSS